MDNLIKFPANKKTDTSIYVIDDCLLPNLCEMVRHYIDRSCTRDEKEFNPSTNVRGKTNTICRINNRDLHDIITQSITEKIMNIFPPYIPLNRISSLRLRKIYGRTRCHVDNPNSQINVPGIKTVPIDKLRSLSVIIALNSDYDGGEVVFPIQNVRVKLKIGQALVFPPYWTHPHYVTSPENGTFRYTINTWICG